jgi:hypothetical protein
MTAAMFLRIMRAGKEARRLWATRCFDHPTSPVSIYWMIIPAQGLASGAQFTFARSNISGIDRAEKVAVHHVDPGVAVAVR